MPKTQPKSSAPVEASKAKLRKTLPATIVNALPVSAKIMSYVIIISQLVPTLEKELAAAKKAGAIPLARAFVALHRLVARIDEELGPVDEVFKRYKEQEVPATLEAEGISNVPLSEGFRIGLSHRLFASIPAENRDRAYQWLRENGLADLITATVNAGTLSAAAKTLMEEKNAELPKELFNVALVPNTSVTSTS